jgi:hypothetical protein
LIDEVPDRLGMRERTIVGVVGHVAERVEAKDEGKLVRPALGISDGF